MSIYIAFGLSGAGKTYFAKWFAKSFHVHYEDGDDWLTEEMRQSIREGELFTPAMLDNYVCMVSDKITALKARYTHLIISQALYLERNRLQILSAHPEARFILVSADEDMIQHRLELRGNEVTLAYAKANAGYFESPTHEHIKIDNSKQNANNELMAQCLKFEDIKKLKKSTLLSRIFGTNIRSLKNKYQRSFQRKQAC